MHGHHDLEELDEAASWERLASVPIARVGVVLDGRIDVLPVNHLVHEGRVCWRTTSGTKLAVAARELPVAVEADQIDPQTRAGWSVLLHGVARIVTEAARLEALELVGFEAWTSPDQRTMWIEVEPTSISGREVS